VARVEFEADTTEALVEMARRWVAAYPEFASAESGDDEPTLGAESLEDVLGRIHSPASRQFLREVAERTLAGETLVIDDALRVRCGLPPGRTFVGVLGVANRTMRQRAGRRLVIWDAAASGYRVDPDDARIVLATLGPSGAADVGG